MRQSIRLGMSSIVAALLVSAPVSAQNRTINFGRYSSPTATEYQATYGRPVSAGGLDFFETAAFNGGASRNVLGTWGTSDLTSVNRPSNIGNSTALFATRLGLEIDIFHHRSNFVAGKFLAFSLRAIDVAHLYSNPYSPFTLSPFTLEFFAFGPGFQVFSQRFEDIPAPPLVGDSRTPQLQTLQFDARFRNVYNVWWYQGTGSGTAHQFTNVSANVVPEPVSMVLLGTGLAGVAAARRRRRKDRTDA